MKTVKALCFMVLLVLVVAQDGRGPCGCRRVFDFCANDYTTYHSICEYKCKHPSTPFHDWYILYHGPCHSKPDASSTSSYTYATTDLIVTTDAYDSTATEVPHSSFSKPVATSKLPYTYGGDDRTRPSIKPYDWTTTEPVATSKFYSYDAHDLTRPSIKPYDWTTTEVPHSSFSKPVATSKLPYTYGGDDRTRPSIKPYDWTTTEPDATSKFYSYDAHDLTRPTTKPYDWTTTVARFKKCGCKPDYQFCSISSDCHTYDSICEYRCNHRNIPFEKKFIKHDGKCRCKRVKG